MHIAFRDAERTQLSYQDVQALVNQVTDPNKRRSFSAELEAIMSAKISAPFIPLQNYKLPERTFYWSSDDPPRLSAPENSPVIMAAGYNMVLLKNTQAYSTNMMALADNLTVYLQGQADAALQAERDAEQMYATVMANYNNTLEVIRSDRNLLGKINALMLERDPVARKSLLRRLNQDEMRPAVTDSQRAVMICTGHYVTISRLT